MTAWASSDHHFDHQNILRLCNRPYKNLDEMNEDMVDRWNSVVKPEDVVYHLGDLCHWHSSFGKWWRRLNGRKIWIPGNHTPQDVYSGVWQKFCYGEHIEAEIAGTLIVMNHYPILEWNGWFKNAIHIHGHTHGNIPDAGRMYDVGVDTNDFTPVNLEELVAKLKKLPRVKWQPVIE